LLDIFSKLRQLLESQEMESLKDERKNDMASNMPTGSNLVQYLHILPSLFDDNGNKQNRELVQ
jgi:hypothetical protein